ncbi:MAG: hypothetical protein GJ680_04565 [Alteromonadaceae bacterium]|nr:hypothetical protein [Alteromonadaceae bacterium]
MATFEYKGFLGSMEFRPDACYFFGQIQLNRDTVSYRATSPTQLEENFRISVDNYIEDCAAIGIEPG